MISGIFKQHFSHFVLLFSCTNVLSQSEIGLVGGLNHSSIAIDHQSENATLINRNGIIIGISCNYNLSEQVYISGQLRYIETGQDVKWSQFIFDYSELQINYLQLPIHFNYRFQIKNLKPKLICGPYIGYLLNATGRVKVKDKIVDESEYEGLKDFDFGIDIGAGVDINISNNYNLFIDVYYSHGRPGGTKEEIYRNKCHERKKS